MMGLPFLFAEKKEASKTNCQSKSQLEALRKRFPAGARIELTKDLDDPYTVIPAGSRGTVLAIDDIGTIRISWDCSSSLGLIPGVDEFHCIPNAAE